MRFLVRAGLLGAILLNTVAVSCGPGRDHSKASLSSYTDSLTAMRVAAAAGDTTASVWVARALTRNGEEIVDTAAVYGSLRDAAQKSCLGAMVLLGDSYLELSPSFRHLAPDFEAAEGW